MTYREFRQVCLRFEQHADPDGTYRDHELSRENRSVSCSQVGAGHVLTVTGDALTGDILTEILDAHTATELETDLAARRALFGDQATAHPLPRTARQRRYDALVAIFLKAAGTTTSTDRRPLVDIVCTERSLTAAIRDHAADVVDLRLPHAETAAGTPVDAKDLLVAALIGNIRRVVVDSVGRSPISDDAHACSPAPPATQHYSPASTAPTPAVTKSVTSRSTTSPPGPVSAATPTASTEDPNADTTTVTNTPATSPSRETTRAGTTTDPTAPKSHHAADGPGTAKAAGPDAISRL